jgi:hypothetical protein
MIAYLDVTSPPCLHCQFDFVEDLSLFFEIMASRMVTSYGPQVAQANEEPPLESSLDLTLTQHPRDEEPEIRKVRVHLEVEPPRAGTIIFCRTPAPW